MLKFGRAILSALGSAVCGAQRTKLPDALTNRASKLEGIEVFPGVGTPLSRTTRYGASFVAIEREESFIALFGWVNYTPIFFKPFTECTVTGGCWILLAVDGLRYRSLLGGSFEGGTVTWNENAKLAQAMIRMSAPEVVGDLTATLNHFPFPPAPPRIEGTLRLEPGAAAGP